MSWTSRVYWEEGMFLRAQHFQQQDRWTESALRARATLFGPHWWGFSDYEVDQTRLAIGSFALHSASGAWLDGVPFSFPNGNADEPPPLELNAGVRDTLVYLAVPAPPAYSLQAGQPDSVDDYRLALRRFEATDTHSGSPEAADLVVGQLRSRLLLGTAERSGYQCIPVARVREVSPDKHVLLDNRFIPPVVSCRAAAPLAGFINELAGMLAQRCEELGGRLADSGVGIMAEQADFLMLMAANRWLPVLRHWAAAPVLHPAHLYETIVQIAGEMATFSAANRNPEPYPPYQHDDLQSSFAPVIASLRNSLSLILRPGVVEIPLEVLQYGARRGKLVDRSVLQATAFYLVVRVSRSEEEVRRLFPAQAKIGAIEQMRALVNAAVAGIKVRPLATAPRQLPFLRNAIYFELDRGSPHWAQMQNSPAFGIHVSGEPQGEFPDLQMQLWSVR